MTFDEFLADTYLKTDIVDRNTFGLETIGIRPEHVEKYATFKRKIFDRSGLKEDMNSIVGFMLDGKANFDTDIFEMCIKNGASKDFSPSELGKITVLVQDDDLVKDILKINRDAIEQDKTGNKDFMKLVVSVSYWEDYNIIGHRVIQTCFDLGMPPESIAEIKTSYSCIEEFIENKANLKTILKYAENNPSDLNDYVKPLLDYGCEPKEIIKISHREMRWLNDKSFNELWEKDPIQTHSYAMKYALESEHDDVIDGTIDRIRAKGMVPNIYGYYNTDVFNKPLTDKLISVMEQNEDYYKKDIQNLLNIAVRKSRKDLVDKFIADGAKIDQEAIERLGFQWNRNVGGQVVSTEGIDMLKHLVSHHGYRPVQSHLQLFKDDQDAMALFSKSELKDRLTSKLVLTSAPKSSLSKRMKSQGMKI